MKKLSTIALAMAMMFVAGSSFAKGNAYPACKDLKGKERSACIKSERAKKNEAKKDSKSDAKQAKETKKDTKTTGKADAAPAEGSK